MEHGHPVAPSNGHQQMLRPHAPVSDEEPRAQADLRSAVGDEEAHHEKKPMMTKMKDKMRKIKNTVTKKKHGHVDDHDVHVDDDEHSVETEGECERCDDPDEEMETESATTPHGLGGGDKPFTTDRRDEPIDLGTQDSLGGRDDPLPLSSRGEHVPLSSRDDRPITLASRDQHVPAGGHGSNISDPKRGNEQSVSPDILSSFRDMEISSEVEKKPSYTEKPTATAAAVSASSTVYAKVASSNQSGEKHDRIATPVSTGPGVEVEPRESAGEKKGSYTEKLSSTAVAVKSAAVSAASTVYAKVAGGTHPGQTHDQIATPVSTGHGVEVEPKEGAGEKKGGYTEKLSSTAVAAKDAAVSAASTVYAKVAGCTHSGEKHDQIATPLSTGPGVEVERTEGAGEKKGTYTEKLTGTAMAAKDVAMNAASTVYGKVTGKVQPGGGTEQEKGVSVREYLAEKLRPGEDDKALCEVISESMKKRGVEEQEAVEEKECEVKGRIVLPEVTAGEIGVKRVVGKEGGGDGGEGMMKKINGAVSSMVRGGGGSGGPVAAAEGIGGGAAKERAHE